MLFILFVLAAGVHLGCSVAGDSGRRPHVRSVTGGIFKSGNDKAFYQVVQLDNLVRILLISEPGYTGKVLV